MQLDLHEIINIPGREVKFSYAPDFAGFTFQSVLGWAEPFLAEGTVRNRAGVLELHGTLKGSMNCACARCLREFTRDILLPLEATLTDELSDEDEDDPSLFALQGDNIDLDEVAAAALVLNMEQQILCSEDCKGLCSKCGKDLNDGPCDCRADVNPRFAVLAQLLEEEQK